MWAHYTAARGGGGEEYGGSGWKMFPNQPPAQGAVASHKSPGLTTSSEQKGQAPGGRQLNAVTKSWPWSQS